jgi:hypothetical protein
MIIKKDLDIEIIEKNILIIHNFVNKEESEKYLQVANSVKEEEWWKENSGWYKGKYLNVSQNYEIQKISNNIIKRFSELFKNGETYTYGSPSSIHRMSAGQEMFVHADFSEIDDQDDSIILFNTAIYHNSVEGGEIYYPELGIQYHPKQGDLVLHPGTTKYRHGVKKVLNDTRYISTLWVANDKGMKIKTSGEYNG